MKETLDKYVNTLRKGIRDFYENKVSKNKSKIYDLLTNIKETTEKIIAKLYRIAKESKINIDIGELKEKTKEGFRTTKKTITDFIKSDDKKQYLKDTFTKVASVIKEKVEIDTEKEQGPPEETQSESKESKDKSFLSRVKDKAVETVKGIPNWLEKQKEIENRRRQEIREEKAKSKEKDKDNKKGRNWFFSAMLAGIKGITSILTTISSGVFGLVGKVLGSKFVFDLISGTVLDGNVKLTKIISKITQKGVGKLVKGAFKLGAKTIKNIPGITRWVGRTAGSFLLRFGTTLLPGLANPFVLGATLVATAGYLGYKRYERVNAVTFKNDLVSKIKKLRFMLYGYSVKDDTDKSFLNKIGDFFGLAGDNSNVDRLSKILDLELLLIDNLVKRADGSYGFNKITEEQLAEIYNLFGIDVETEDPVALEKEKEKISILLKWLYHRFLPIYLEFLTKIKQFDTDYTLLDTDDLDKNGLAKYYKSLKVNYRVLQVPLIPEFDNPNSVVTREAIDSLIKEIDTEVEKILSKQKTDEEKGTKVDQKKPSEKIEDKFSNFKFNEVSRFNIKLTPESGLQITHRLNNEPSKLKVTLPEVTIPEIFAEAEKIYNTIYDTNSKNLFTLALKELIKYRVIYYGFIPDKSKNKDVATLIKTMLALEIIAYRKIIENINTGSITYSSRELQEIIDLLNYAGFNDITESDLRVFLTNDFTVKVAKIAINLYRISKTVTIDKLDTLTTIELYNFIRTLPANITTLAGSKDFYQNPFIKLVSVKELEFLLSEKIKLINMLVERLKEQEQKKDIEKFYNQNLTQYIKRTQQNDFTKPVELKNEKTLTDYYNEVSKNKPQEKASNKPLTAKSQIVNEDTEDSQLGSGKASIDTNTKSLKPSVNINSAPGPIEQGSIEYLDLSKTPIEKIENLNPNVKELLLGMAKEYNNLTGKKLPIYEAFRSTEDQMAIYRKYGGGRAANPGSSTHEYGLAIDIPSAVADELDQLGLLKKYGFTRPIGEEKWHLEPIGVSLNPALAKKDSNFANLATLASPGKGGDGYGVLSNARKYGRDYFYQLEIYNKSAKEPIKPENIKNSYELAQALKGNIQPLNIDEKQSPIQMASVTPKSDIATTSNTMTSDIDAVLSSNAEKQPLAQPTQISNLTTNYNKNEYIDNPFNNKIAKVSNLEKIDPEKAIQLAASQTGFDPNLLKSVAMIESSMRPNAKNPNSSATGLFQFTKSTWKYVVNKYGKTYGIPNDAEPNHPYYSALLASLYMKDNLTKLGDYQSLGINDQTAAYMIHHYGPNGAKKLIEQIRKNPNAPMSKLVSGEIYRANYNELKGKTGKDYLDYLTNKIDRYMDKPTTINSNEEVGQSQIKIAQDEKTNLIPLETKPKSIERKAITEPSITSLQLANTPVGVQRRIETQEKPLINIDLSTLESISKEQLNALMQIKEVLDVINGKIDFDKLNSIIKENRNQNQVPNLEVPNTSKIPVNSVDLSRKNIRHI